MTTEEIIAAMKGKTRMENQRMLNDLRMADKITREQWSVFTDELSSRWDAKGPIKI